MSRRFAWMALVMLGLVVGNANADEAKIRQLLQSKFPTMVVDSVTKSPFGGLYEVVLDGEVVYTNENVEFFLAGNLYDMRISPTRNLTQERAIRIQLNSSLDQAIRRVLGNGKRMLYTFEDPNCGYCKQLHRELAKLNDVTIYTFLLPILSQDSVDKSRAVWCAKDRAKAWDDLMARSVVSTEAIACSSTPIEKNLQLMQRFGIRGTPAIYLGNGQQIGGYVPAEKIEQALSAVPAR